MNFFRTFLDSFRERVTSVKTYISILVFGDSSISSVIVHKPSPLSDDATAPSGDVYYSTDEESDNEFYDRRMYMMYLNMTKAVRDKRWTFAEYRAVLVRDRL